MVLKTQDKRIAYFDFLRIFATFAIMIQHIDPYGSADPTTAMYVVRLIFDLLTRWGVNIFLMISGALFLGSESSIKRIYTHNILRIFTSFVFWSALYSVIRTAIYHYGFTNMVIEFVFGHYHMWFLCMIVELYILTPILRKAIVSWKIGKYLLAILFIYSCLMPQTTDLLAFVSPTLADLVGETFSKYFRNHFHTGLFYYVLGYYLSKCRLTACRSRIIYIAGILGALVSGVATYMLARMGNQSTVLLERHMITMLAFTVAIFVFARNHFSFDRMKKKTVSLILKLSKYSFGAYLAHALVLEMMMEYIGREAFQVGAFLSIPLVFIIVCVISFAISAILNHIPLLKKYIV